MFIPACPVVLIVLHAHQTIAIARDVHYTSIMNAQPTRGLE
jgi:hypothetical protein